MSSNSFSIFALYPLIKSKNLEPLLSSFYSMDEIDLQALLLVPTEFLYATDRRFLSSLDNSYPVIATSFIFLTISSYRSAYSASLAK
jgi:hypothetical protein